MKKTWEAQHNGNHIVVTNEWSFSGETSESVTINGDVMLSRSYDMMDVSLTRALGTIFTINYGDDVYRIVCGSAWHCFGVACRIEANGKPVGGNRIVLFAKLPQSATVTDENVN